MKIKEKAVIEVVSRSVTELEVRVSHENEKQNTERNEMNATAAGTQIGGGSGTSIGTAFDRGPGRVIHFIDIENIANGPRLTEDGVRRARAIYMKSGLYRPGDLVFIACGSSNRAVVRFGWPDAHLTIRRGRDGADFALIEAIKRENVPERFARAVIASGDGIFATRAEVLRRSGVEVTVVAPPRGLSSRLRGAASHTALIDTDRLNMFFLNDEANRG